MANETMGLFWYTESPLHAGSGATLSAIDLPIQRETHTGNAVVYGSGIKGALRERVTLDDVGNVPEPYEAVFGPRSDRASDHGGLGVFSEARVVLFPVACIRGGFVWVTCPGELHRLKRDLRAIGSGLTGTARTFADALGGLTIPQPGVSGAAASSGCDAIINSKIALDEAQPLDLHVPSTADAARIALWFSEHAFPAGEEYGHWRELAAKNIVIVHNEEFSYLVQYATHVEVHVKIGAAGTVEEGPWSEESLPPDTLLHSTIILQPALSDAVKKKLGDKSAAAWMAQLLAGNPRFQLGGHQSVGKGWVRPRELS